MKLIKIKLVRKDGLTNVLVDGRIMQGVTNFRIEPISVNNAIPKVAITVCADLEIDIDIPEENMIIERK